MDSSSSVLKSYSNSRKELHRSLSRKGRKNKEINNEFVSKAFSDIKYDSLAKLIIFYAAISAYSKNSQLQVIIQGLSGSGKTYIPSQIMEVFPRKNVIKLAHASTKAFYHMKTGKRNIVDLRNKIILFLDMPHYRLLETLRPIISGDASDQNYTIQIVDENKNTKKIVIKGRPSIIFPTTNLRMDEQENTRFLIISPETSEEKTRDAIDLILQKAVDPYAKSAYKEQNVKERRILKKVIERISRLPPIEVYITAKQKDRIREAFRQRGVNVRLTRSLQVCLNLIKAHAIVNILSRQVVDPARKRRYYFLEDQDISHNIGSSSLRLKKGDTLSILAEDEDVEECLRIYGNIAGYLHLGLSPYVYDVYDKVLGQLWKKSDKITPKEIAKKHFEYFGLSISLRKLNEQIVPLLEEVGLVYREENSSDKRTYFLVDGRKQIEQVEGLGK